MCYCCHRCHHCHHCHCGGSSALQVLGVKICPTCSPGIPFLLLMNPLSSFPCLLPPSLKCLKLCGCEWRASPLPLITRDTQPWSVLKIRSMRSRMVGSHRRRLSAFLQSLEKNSAEISGCAGKAKEGLGHCVGISGRGVQSQNMPGSGRCGSDGAYSPGNDTCR